MPALSRSRSPCGREKLAASVDDMADDDKQQVSEIDRMELLRAPVREVERRVHPHDWRKLPYTFKDVLNFHGNLRKAEAMWEESAPWKPRHPCEDVERRVFPSDPQGTLYSFEDFVVFKRGNLKEAKRLWEESVMPFHHELERMASLLDVLPDGASVAMITMRGSLCPITLGHVQSFIEARKLLCGCSDTPRPARLENFSEALGFIALNGDNHVARKMRLQGEACLDFISRQYLVDLSVAEYDWVAREAAEGAAVVYFQTRWPRLRFVHFTMNGADDVVQYGKVAWSNVNARYITMGRPGYTEKLLEAMRVARVDPDAGYFVLGPELPDISSTAARRAILNADYESLSKLLHPSVAEWCLANWPTCSVQEQWMDWEDWKNWKEWEEWKDS